MGVCSTSDGEHFPFQMDIAQVDGKKFSGTIQWPTLNAKTKIKGTIENDIVKFKEHEAITGGDEIVLNSKYEGKLASNGKMIDGKVTSAPGSDDESESESQSTFHLDRIENTLSASAPAQPAAPAVPAAKKKNSSSSSDDDTFEPGKAYNGSIVIEQTFNLQIKKRKGTTIEGTIKWPTYKSKFKGKVENSTITFEEYEILKQKVPDEKIVLPRLYKSKIDKKNSVIEGDFGPNVNQTQGTFKMKI